MEVPALLHAVVQELPQQVKQHRVADVPAELVIQPGFINGGVIVSDIGAEYEWRTLLTKVVVGAQDALSPSAVSPDVLTQGMDRQLRFQHAGEHFQHHGIGGGPEGHGFAGGLSDNLQRRQNV